MLSEDRSPTHEFVRSPRALIEIVDYLLVTTDLGASAVPAGHDRPVSLPSGIRIECLGPAFAERLLDAAEPRGENWEATRQFGVVHAYVRTVWKEANGPDPDALYSWDHKRRLYPCVQLSRLVRDNAVGTEYAIRLLRRGDGSERLVPFAGYESHVAYRLHPEERGGVRRRRGRRTGPVARLLLKQGAAAGPGWPRACGGSIWWPGSATWRTPPGCGRCRRGAAEDRQELIESPVRWPCLETRGGTRRRSGRGELPRDLRGPLRFGAWCRCGSRRAGRP